MRNFWMVTKGEPKGAAAKFIKWVIKPGNKTVRKIVASEWIPIVIVTHNLQQAFRVADHVAFMHLDSTLVSVPLLEPGREAVWVDDQIPPHRGGAGEGERNGG